MSSGVVAEFLNSLHAQDVRLWIEDGRLRCNGPKGALTAELKSELAERKSDLIAALETGLTPVPLTSAQRRLWLLDRLAPGDPAFNVGSAIRWTGPVDIPRLEAALDGVLQHHDALRWTFFEQHGEPWGRVAPPARVTLEQRPLATAETPEAAVKTISASSFDLARGPLFRALLLNIAQDDHVLILLAHHIVVDGLSGRLLLGDLLQRYAHPATNIVPSKLSFTDWVRRGGDAAATDPASLPYWIEQLADLPTDCALPVSKTFQQTSSRGMLHHFEAPPLPPQDAFTPAAVLFGAFFLLLARYTGQDDLFIGTPFANRSSNAPDIAGNFVNTLVLRVSAAGRPTAREFLQRVQTTLSDALAHGDAPYEQIVEKLSAARRSSSATPMFRYLLTALPGDDALPQLPGVTLQALDVDPGACKQDLALHVHFDRTRLSGVIEYRTDVFAPATIARLAAQYQQLVHALAEDLDRTIDAIPLLTPADRAVLLNEWNDTAVATNSSGVLHELIAEQAARTPDALAVQAPDGVLTYRELLSAATALAARLQSEHGAGPGTRVGLLFERSTALVVALVGVLQTGAAYVPFDPAQPAERLAYMQQDAGLCALVTGLDPLLPSPASTTFPQVQPGDPAYVIYTSGSTGRPKGVVVTHGGVVNLLRAMARATGFTPQDVWLSVTTISFDIAALELFLPLITGAKVVIASREETLDGAQLARLLDATGATFLQATPATWRLLLESNWQPAIANHLRALCGGEALPTGLAAALLPRVGRLWNLYGPTETTIWSTIHEVHPGEDPVPIGRPLDNTQVYVLDTQQQTLVPIGVPGELYIAGAGVAVGYWNQPERTAERFLPCPFQPRERRMYRTGDLVRWRPTPEGTLEYLGRLDHQVKIRGHRIELGEIESHLRQYPGVTDAVVNAREDQLIAYLEQSQPLLDEATLRAYLRARLPEPMRPAQFVPLAAFPRTPNGKLDRAALPAAKKTTTLPTMSGAPPRPGLETALAAAWCDILQRDRIGRQDNFFDAGGHSFLAARLHARLRDDLGLTELSLIDLFHYPTIEALALHLESRRQQQEGAA